MLALLIIVVMIGSNGHLPVTSGGHPFSESATPLSKAPKEEFPVYKGFSNFSGLGSTTISPAESFIINWTKEPPKLSVDTLNELENRISEINLVHPPILTSNETVLPAKAGTQTDTQKGPQSGINETATKLIFYQTIAEGDFRLFRDDGNIATPENSFTGEPAVANAITTNGELILYSANHFVAKAIYHSGILSNWVYATSSPTNPNSFNGVFSFDNAGDNDVVYDPHNRIFIWYMQGQNGSFKLSTSRDLDHWNSWNVRAYGFDSRWTVPLYANLWWDYPQLAISNNNLFITTNVMVGNPEGNPPTPSCGGTVNGVMLGCGSNSYETSIVMRINLGQLSQGLHPIPLNYIFDGIGFGLAEGASDEMFFAAHLENNLVRVFGWNDALASPRVADIHVPAWNHTGATDCRVMDGSNPCSSILYQIRSGWIKDGKVGFFWNVGAGCTSSFIRPDLVRDTCFPFPYVNAATFSATTLAYLGRPYLWHPNFAWVNAFASPNDRGVGIVAWKVGGTAGYPQVKAGIDDNFNGDPPGWEMHVVATGNAVTTGFLDRLGDYLRVQDLLVVVLQIFG